MLMNIIVVSFLGLVIGAAIVDLTSPATPVAVAVTPTVDPVRYRQAMLIHDRIAAQAAREEYAWSEHYRIAWVTEHERKAWAEAARIQQETDEYLAQQLAAQTAREAASQAASSLLSKQNESKVGPPVPIFTPAVSEAKPEPQTTVVAALVAASGSIAELAVMAGWPAALAAKVERTAMCESSGQTAAVSPAGYRGLMQVAPWLHGAVPADAVGQLAQAYRVYQAQGWAAWPVCGR